jgi:hypothetical protein
MYFHSASLQPITAVDRNRWDYINQKGVGKTAIESFSVLEFLMNFFGIFKNYDTTIKFKSTSFHCSDTGCKYYKVDYKTIFQDVSNEEFIILSHIVHKL